MELENLEMQNEHELNLKAIENGERKEERLSVVNPIIRFIVTWVSIVLRWSK